MSYKKLAAISLSLLLLACKAESPEVGNAIADTATPVSSDVNAISDEAAEVSATKLLEQKLKRNLSSVGFTNSC